MEQILEKLETLIDDVERDEELDKDEILQELQKLKIEMEDYQLGGDEGGDLQWDDLD